LDFLLSFSRFWCKIKLSTKEVKKMSNLGNKETMSKNLRYYIEKSGKERAELCQIWGFPYSTVTEWINGKEYPRIDRIEIMANYFGIQKSDLIEERPLTTPTPQPSIPTAKNIIPMPEMRKIPLLGTIACGEPILAVENIAEYVDIPKNIPADLALSCKGDSMIQAHILDGSIVYVRIQPDVENGEIAAVLIGDEATLKRVYKTATSITLMPENNRYAPIVLTGEDMNTVRIIGKAVAFTAPVV
jgi:repressor LexA